MFQIPLVDSFVQKFTPHSLGDLADRLHYLATSGAFLGYAIALGGKQLMGRPMVCWPNAEWKAEWNAYAEQRCFAQFVYYFPMDRFRSLPDVDGMLATQVTFFRWAPVVAFAQAALYYMPNWVWKKLHRESRFNWDDLVVRVKRLRKLDENAEKKRQRADETGEKTVRDERRLSLAVLVKDIDEELGVSKPRREPRRVFEQKLGAQGWWVKRYQAMFYIATKVFYLVNTAAQLKVLDRAIAMKEASYFNWALNFLTGGRWLGQPNTLPLFPVTVLCRFAILPRVGDLGQLGNIDVMCDIVSNLWNMMFYTAYCAWGIFLLVTMAWSLLRLLYSLTPKARCKRIRQLLDDNSVPEELIRDFADEGLGWNGVLLLHFIEINAGGEWAKDICKALFKIYKPREMVKTGSTLLECV